MNLSELNFIEFDTYLLSQKSLIIHQVWFTNICNRQQTQKLYSKLKMCRDSWDIHNSNLLHIIWNQERSLHLIKNFFPEYLDLYKNYSYEIQRCDFVRYCLLYRYGGIYVDMDYKCKKPFSIVFKKWNVYSIYFVESSHTCSISNSLMISYEKKHIFWKILLMEIYKNSFTFKNFVDSSKHIDIIYTTGPGILSKIYNIYKYRYKLGILPCELFNPLNVKTSLYEINDKENIYCIHYGLGSWESTDSKIIIELYKNYKILLFIIFIMLGPQILLNFV